MWRDWFSFSRQDRRAILLLSLLIVVALALLWTKPMWQGEKPYERQAPDSLVLAFDDSRHTDSWDETIAVSPRPFDPNMADSVELLSVGLSSYVTRNILRYRRAGGVFRKPEDLARIYGLHDTVFARLRPYIYVKESSRATVRYSAPDTTCLLPDTTLRRENPSAAYMRNKYRPGKFVDLNTADTTELMRIPGIGPVRARHIVEYRQSLGGFHSIAQVHEAYDLPEHLGDWIHISAPTIEPLRVNKVSLEKLRSHPYLTFYQARAIIELRRREGRIRSARQLLFLEEFTESDIARLTPYLSFE